MTMKKRLVLYGIAGFIAGPFINTVILLCINYANATQWGWVFSPVVPALVDIVGNQLNAYLLQFILAGLMGAGFAMASLIWQVERWGYTKQTILHFLSLVSIMFPIAYFARWIDHSLGGVLGFFLVFVAIYIGIWVVATLSMRHKIKAMNQHLGANKPKS